MVQTTPEDEILAAVQRQARAVLALAPAEREQRYRRIRECFAEAARKHGRSERDATAWGARVEEWVRALVAVAGRRARSGQEVS